MGSHDDSSPSDGQASAAPEAQRIDLQAVFEQIKGKPCRVDRIGKVYENVDSKRLRTRSHVIDRELERVYDANTLEEIHEALEEAGRNLTKLQIFSNVQMLVHEEPEDDPELVSVMINVEEKNWYKLHAATYVQGNETSFEIKGGLRNLTGMAESVEVSAELGSEFSRQVTASFEQPKPWDLPVTTSVRVSQLMLNNRKASSHMEFFRGVALGLRSFDDVHSVEYELGWRRLADPSGVASRAVLSQVGDYVKSALKYSWRTGNQSLDESTGQVAGWAARTTSEASGLGFDDRVRFVKQRVDWQAILPVSPLVSLTLSASAGVMLPWGNDYASKATCIADRFFLGSPLLRGFKFKSVGASDARRPVRNPTATGDTPADDAAAAKLDSLGGDVYASMTAALLFQPPHPALRALKLQGQLFVNGGSCVQLSGTGRSIQSNLQDFSRTLRWSTGAGLVLPTKLGQFEANYVVVLSHQESDRLKQGFQLGFAASPLMA